MQVINEFGATRFDVAVRALRGELDPPEWVEVGGPVAYRALLVTMRACSDTAAQQRSSTTAQQSSTTVAERLRGTPTGACR